MNSNNSDILSNYSDKEIVEGILSGNQKIITSFFCINCKNLFCYIHTQICDGTIEINEIANNIILYLSENEWSKLRSFDYRSKLITWILVVAMRYYKKIMNGVVEFQNDFTQIDRNDHPYIKETEKTDAKIDVYHGLSRMPNQRYRMIIEKLDLLDVDPELLATEMKITTANLYNIHRRALQQLKIVMLGKEIAYE